MEEENATGGRQWIGFFLELTGGESRAKVGVYLDREGRRGHMNGPL
jgi:hypothetical protein